LTNEELLARQPVYPNYALRSLMRDGIVSQEQVRELRAEVKRLRGILDDIELQRFKPNGKEWNRVYRGLPIKAKETVAAFLKMSDIWSMRFVCEEWYTQWNPVILREFKRRFYARMDKIPHFPVQRTTLLWPESTFAGSFVVGTLL